MKVDQPRSSVHSFSMARETHSAGNALAGFTGDMRVDAPPSGALPSRDTQASGWSNMRERLGPQELRRRLWHMTPGFLPFILWAVPHEDPLSQTLKSIMIALAVVISTGAWLKHRTFRRRGEKSLLPAVLGYSGIVVGMLVLFPATPELGLAVMSILAFGDGSATLVGILAGGEKLPWNPEKSWAGLAAFLTFSIPLATIVCWGEAQPHLSMPAAFCCVAPAGLLAGLAESLPSRINDNIRVGLVAAVTIVVTHAMFVAR